MQVTRCIGRTREYIGQGHILSAQVSHYWDRMETDFMGNDYDNQERLLLVRIALMCFAPMAQSGGMISFTAVNNNEHGFNGSGIVTGVDVTLSAERN
jgi:hypothetical protein